MLEMTRSILKHTNMPNYMWGEGIRHTTYLINRVATRSLNAQTPYEVFKGRKPSVKHLRVFGCIGHTKIDAPHLRKLDDMSRVLIHLGTEPGSKAYRLLDPTTKRIVVSRDVVLMKADHGYGAKHGMILRNQERSRLNLEHSGTKASEMKRKKQYQKRIVESKRKKETQTHS